MTETDITWKSLYKIGGLTALILLIYSLVTMVLLVTIDGQPESAQEGFTMLQNNRLVGLLRLDVLTILVIPLYYLLFLGLYMALKKTHAVSGTLVFMLTFAGVTLALATPSAFSFLTLSDKFAAATSEAQKTLLLAAGQAILASDLWHGSGAIMGGILLQTGAVLISVLMLESKSFAKATAYIGIVMHSLDLAHILIGFFLPAGGVILMAIAGPLYLVWFPLLARDFFQVGGGSKVTMNRATRIIISTIGTILGIAGIDHGFFETLQGNTPTDGLIIQAIGDIHQMWFYGTEEAFTIVPNFLITGILAILVSLAIMAWSVGFVHTKHGAIVFGLLFILLFLVGGGIAAQIMFVPVTWAVATRINKPLTWWRRVLPENVRRVLARLWSYSLIAGSISFLIGLFIAVTGYVPGERDSELILNICWSFIFGGGLGMFLLTFIAGSAYDIQAQRT